MVFQVTSGYNQDLLLPCNPFTEEGREWIDEYTVYAQKAFMGTATALAFTSAAVALIAGNFFHAIRYLALGIMGCYGFYLVDQQSGWKNLHAQVEELKEINAGLEATKQRLEGISSNLQNTNEHLSGNVHHLESTNQQLETNVNNLAREFDAFRNANQHLVRVAARVEELKEQTTRLEAGNEELEHIRDTMRQENEQYTAANRRHLELLQSFQNLFTAFMEQAQNSNPAMYDRLTDMQRQLSQLQAQAVSS